MDINIFNLPDPSGRFSKESFVAKNYPDEYNHIINYCLNNNLSEITFKEKVYLCKQNINSLPKCKNSNCNNLVKFKNSTIGYLRYCSNKCISSDEQIKKIKEEKSFEKFGTKAPAMSNSIKEKMIKTNKKRYGGNSPMSNTNIQEKSKQTLIGNWGVDNPARSKDILEKRVKSFKDNHNVWEENYRNTSLKRYGTPHPWMNKNIHKKSIDFFYRSYKKRIEEKLDNKRYKFISFITDNINTDTQLKLHCNDCNKEFNILTYQFYYRIGNNNGICTNCYPISENSSITQSELSSFISKSYNGRIQNDARDIINPYEIDIYLPDIKLAIEFNGVFWHSNKFKNKKYHKQKQDIANEKGINLITIWEDDWIRKKGICESFILNKLNKSKKIWARKCKIKEVNYIDSKHFLDYNHFQGDCKSPIRLGLYYDNELYSLMLFSKLRLPLNSKSDINSWELTRFCNKNGNSIVGGASKLLKFFIENYKPLKIISYSDNMISDGKLYENLGFKYSHTSEPGYWYVINKKREHRFNWRKSKLVKLGHSKDKTEEEIMMELGHYRIYNAGNKKWILNL